MDMDSHGSHQPSYMTFPSTIVATILPVKLQPSYGVFLDFDFDCEASKVHFFLGSKMVTSACEPGARLPRRARPKILAGFAESNSTMRHSGRLKCRCNTVSAIATAVSKPVMPKAARSNSTCFSWKAWGAWSVAMASID